MTILNNIFSMSSITHFKIFCLCLFFRCQILQYFTLLYPFSLYFFLYVEGIMKTLTSILLQCKIESPILCIYCYPLTNTMIDVKILITLAS